MVNRWTDEHVLVVVLKVFLWSFWSSTTDGFWGFSNFTTEIICGFFHLRKISSIFSVCLLNSINYHRMKRWLLVSSSLNLCVRLNFSSYFVMRMVLPFREGFNIVFSTGNNRFTEDSRGFYKRKSPFPEKVQYGRRYDR